jgi:hypothetical protein
MNAEEFKASLADEAPRKALPAPLAALWWDAKGDWTQAHALVDELETTDGMAVHAYLHRKEGSASNADYWYHRAGRNFQRPTLEAEWTALVEDLLSGAKKA